MCNSILGYIYHVSCFIVSSSFYLRFDVINKEGIKWASVNSFHTNWNKTFLHSDPEYKDTPMDIAQLPNLPEKTSESSESSDSESESKENSGR